MVDTTPVNSKKGVVRMKNLALSPDEALDIMALILDKEGSKHTEEAFNRMWSIFVNHYGHEETFRMLRDRIRKLSKD